MPRKKQSPRRPPGNAQLEKDSHARLYAELTIALRALRLPTMRNLFQDIDRQAEQGGWSRLRFLQALLELEMTERNRRRLEDRLRESSLPKGKTFDTFDFACLQAVVKVPHIKALAASSDWLDKGENLLIFGGTGTGKTHLAAAIGHELVLLGRRVLYASTTKIAQELMAAAREARLPAAISKYDRFDLLILDDFSYAKKEVTNTTPLFELISDRYERKALIVTANQPFAEWEGIFADKAMTSATVDRLVHHAVIFNLGSQSFRRKQAVEKTARLKP